MTQDAAKPLIIIGSGLAGYTLAREFRKRDQDTPLQIISADDGSFYSKPMLSNAIARQKQPDELVTASAQKMAQDLPASVLTHTRVEAIDPAGHTLKTDTGMILAWRDLVLAVGARPIPPPLTGDAVVKVQQVNSLDDYRNFRSAIADKQNIAILGPGLIGCEFANDLVQGGYSVSVIGPDATPLGRLVPPGVGGALQRSLTNAGVEWHLGTHVTGVNQADEALRLHLADGTVLHADVVLSAIGLQPETRLAEAAGLVVENGIVVDRLLQTSHPHIYALGDCAEVAGLVLPFVLPLMQCARALAGTLAGSPTPVQYPAMPVVVKTPAWPLVVSPPPRDVGGEWDISDSDTGLRAMYTDTDGALQGFALGGDAVQDRQALTRQLPPLLG
jgi:rubredoxin-NAD+ reductase